MQKLQVHADYMLDVMQMIMNDGLTGGNKTNNEEKGYDGKQN